MRAAVLLCTLAMMACNDGKESPQRVEEGPAVDADREKTIEVGEELYLWTLPIMRSHEAISRLALHPDSGAFLAAPNELMRPGGLLDANFDAIPEVSSDILYVGAALDLRAEPQVFTFPSAADRYHAFQFTDLFGYNFAYVGTRATGGEGGMYVVAGPDWKGDIPEGATLLRSETYLLMMVGRVMVDSRDDIAAAQRTLDQVTLLPLSKYLGQPAPPPPAEPLPVYHREALGLDYIDQLNALLALTQPQPDDEERLRRFAVVGVSPGAEFDRDSLGPGTENALNAGLANARHALRAELTSSGKNGWMQTKHWFGTREQLRGHDLQRAVGAHVALWDASPEEIVYVQAVVDGDGDALDGSLQTYSLTFPEGATPPAGVLWSVTPYGLPERRLVGNEAGRFSIDSRDEVARGPDGSLTITFSAAKPEGADANWLPVSDGPFAVVIRMYVPEEGAQDYVPPPLVKAGAVER